MQLARFPRTGSSFYNDIRQKINQHFETTAKSPTGNFKLFGKAILLWSSFVVLYVIVVFFTPAPWLALT